MSDRQSTPTRLDAIEDPPTQIEDPGTQIEDPGTQIEDPGTQIEDPRTQPALPAGSPVLVTEVLVTEQELVFATAAAVPLPGKRIGHRFVAMVRALLAGLTFPSRPRRRPSTPSRLYYLERARMGREMERL